MAGCRNKAAGPGAQPKPTAHLQFQCQGCCALSPLPGCLLTDVEMKPRRRLLNRCLLTLLEAGMRRVVVRWLSRPSVLGFPFVPLPQLCCGKAHPIPALSTPAAAAPSACAAVIPAACCGPPGSACVSPGGSCAAAGSAPLPAAPHSVGPALTLESLRPRLGTPLPHHAAISNASALPGGSCRTAQVSIPSILPGNPQELHIRQSFAVCEA